MSSSAVAVASPIEVEVYVDAAPPQPEPPGVRRDRSPVAAIAVNRASVVATTTSTVGRSQGRSQDGSQEAPRSYLGMRGAALDLAAHGWDALDHVPAGTQAQPAAVVKATPAPPLEPVATDTETFAVSVERDGTAHVHDKRNFRFVLPSKKTLVEGEKDDSLRPGDGIPTATVPPIGATIAKFDITDFAMRVHGDDPYAAEKLRALDATRDRRAAIGARYQRARLGQAGQLAEANLDQLWDTIHDPAARKQALFELWDECAEVGSEALVKAGTSARARVVKLIRFRLPPGSAEAFTAAELDTLNRQKQSHAVFAPYD